MSLDSNALWFFDGKRLSVTIDGEIRSWKAVSGGVLAEPGHINAVREGNLSIFKPLPNGFYEIKLNGEKYSSDEKDALPRKPDWNAKTILIDIPKKNRKERTAKPVRGNSRMVDKAGKSWFVPIVALNPNELRGKILKYGSLGIHPDGPSDQYKNGKTSEINDGTGGCIGIQEYNTSDLKQIFYTLADDIKASEEKKNPTLCVFIPSNFAESVRNYSKDICSTFHNLQGIPGLPRPFNLLPLCKY